MISAALVEKVNTEGKLFFMILDKPRDLQSIQKKINTYFRRF